jgi:DNA-binding transcriptional LysR family regulator
MAGLRFTHRQLTLFLALIEKGSITAAARACHVTQPTVSAQLKELTGTIGLPLYDQLGGRLVLTEAGEMLARTARQIDDSRLALEQGVAALKGLRQGRLRVAVASTAKYFVPRLLGSFCTMYPEIDIALQVLNRDGVVARLRDNLDDLYVMSMPPSDIRVQQRMLVPNPLVVVAPPSHALAGKRASPLPLRSLRGERFILRELGSGTRLACDAHFRALDFWPDVRLELGSNEAIKEAVAAGLGLAVLSRHALRSGHGGDIVVELAVLGFPVHSSWFVLHPAGKEPSPIAAEFIAHALRASSPAAPRARAPAPAAPAGRKS